MRTAISLLEDGLGGNKFISVGKGDIQSYVRLASLIKTNHTRLEEALQLCQTALTRLPDDFRATREMGHVLLHMRRLDEARVSLQRAVELHPAEPNAHFLLGVTLSDMGDLGRAKASIKRAMDLAADEGARQHYMSHLRTILQTNDSHKHSNYKAH